MLNKKDLMMIEYLNADRMPKSNSNLRNFLRTTCYRGVLMLAYRDVVDSQGKPLNARSRN